MLLSPTSSTANVVPYDANSILAALPLKRRVVVQEKLLLINPLKQLIDEANYNFSAAAIQLKNEVLQGALGDAVKVAALSLGKGKFPSESTIRRWLEAYRKSGVEGLAAKHTGRRCKAEGWHLTAQTLYLKPSKPSMAAVARELREEMNFTCSDKQVAHYLKSLPDAANHPKRVGKKFHQQNIATFKRRSTASLDVGHTYMGDGHRLDVYLAHPETGDNWRAEICVWMDVKSRYITSWEIMDDEGIVGTVNSLVRGMVKHNHVAAALYVDNGCGFKAKVLADEVSGFYERFSMTCIKAIPGNARAKGQVERWFRTMEEDFNKTKFSDVYCGKDQADEVKSRLINDVKRAAKQGKPSPLPTIEQWKAEFEIWLERYHNRPHPEFRHTTPAQLWAGLKRVPVETDAIEMLKHYTTRKVRRSTISLFNREYSTPELAALNGENVKVGYDWWDDSVVIVRDIKTDRLLAQAPITHRADFLYSSLALDANVKRTKGQLKRIDKKRQEIIDRSNLAITHEAQLRALEAIDVDALEAEFTATSVTETNLFDEM